MKISSFRIILSVNLFFCKVYSANETGVTAGFLVSLQDNQNRHLCTASIVSRDRVITACQCHHKTGTALELDLLTEKRFIVAGLVETEEDWHQKRWVVQGIKHPKCERLDGVVWMYDVGYFILDAGLYFNDAVHMMLWPLLEKESYSRLTISFEEFGKTNCRYVGLEPDQRNSSKPTQNHSDNLVFVSTSLVIDSSCKQTLCRDNAFCHPLIKTTTFCAIQSPQNVTPVCPRSPGGVILCQENRQVLGFQMTPRNCSAAMPLVFLRMDVISDFYVKFRDTAFPMENISDIEPDRPKSGTPDWMLSNFVLSVSGIHAWLFYRHS